MSETKVEIPRLTSYNPNGGSATISDLPKEAIEAIQAATGRSEMDYLQGRPDCRSRHHGAAP